jgi:hypothetical protein
MYNCQFQAVTILKRLYEQLHLNLLPSYPHRQGSKLVYRNFRAKATTFLGYQPTRRFCEGFKVAMDWYVQTLTKSAIRH